MTVEERMEALESRASWAIRIAVVACIAVFGAFVWPTVCGQAVVLAKHRLAEPKAVLAIDRSKHASLIVLNEDGKQLLAAGAPDGVAMLALADNTGLIRASLRLQASDGNPELKLLDKDGKLRAVFGLMPDGSPAIIFFDADGKAVWRAGRATR